MSGWNSDFDQAPEADGSSEIDILGANGEVLCLVYRSQRGVWFSESGPVPADFIANSWRYHK